LARTKILMLLDMQGLGAAKIATESKLTYNVVMYHLRLLKSEGTVGRHGDRRYVWIRTGMGQTRLN
jgi:hypothetical protein